MTTTQKTAELEILTLLEARLLTLPRPRTRQQREAVEFWRLLLRRLREDAESADYLSLSDFVYALYNGGIPRLPEWNWEASENKGKSICLAA